MSQTICLNLLLQGDSGSVMPVLQSAKEHIDHWVIAEIGCSEKTLKDIEILYENIPGEIVSFEGENLLEARNSLLAYSRDKADYLLILDSYSPIRIINSEFKTSLNLDAYFIGSEGLIQRSDLRLIQSKVACQFIGSVRPFIVTDAGSSTSQLTDILIQPLNQTSDDENQDIQTLERYLAVNVNDPHALFHLAKLKLAHSDHQDAHTFFARYLSQPHPIDDEWKWYALYSQARLAEHFKHDHQLVIDAYLAAYQFRPRRAEPLFELARFYRQQNSYNLAHIYSSQAIQIPQPTKEAFDLNRQIYEWSIPAEHALICQQLDKHADVIDACNSALVNGKVAINMRESLISSRQRSIDAMQAPKALHNNKIQNRIRLIIPFRNAASYLKNCINSVLRQTYNNFTATFIDDCSTDNSAALIPTEDPRFELVQNAERIGAFLNRMNFINGCDTEDIIFYLDGDDQLSSDNALNHINQIYNDHDCWLSYGQYVSQNGHNGHALPYSSQEKLVLALEKGEMRFPIHPITHRAGLFHRIKDFDPDYQCFKSDQGEWLYYASDAVLARPLFYLAGYEKIHYCNRTLYLYTEGHDTSVNVLNKQEQIETCQTITTRPRLPPVSRYKPSTSEASNTATTNLIVD